MASRPSATFEFSPQQPGTVLDHMQRLGIEHRGWLNLQPGVREEDVPSAGPISMLFAGSVHAVPVCTWVAGHEGRHGVEADALGIQHAAGPRALAGLAAGGLPLPAGWRSAQDHPRRGVVVRTPPGTPHQEQLDWLLRAGEALTAVPVTGDWLATVFEGRRR